RGLRCLRRGLTLRTNRLQQKAYRSRYYARDNARRRLLAAERRRIGRRTTTNPCPTPDEFRAAFARVGESVEAKLLFGGMVHDLACYVDSCLRYDGSGNIVGRNGGIKGWLADNVPELHHRYKTIMRYKALAMRLRQAAGLKDPEPTSTLLDGETMAEEKMHGRKEDADAVGNKIYYAQKSYTLTYRKMARGEMARRRLMRQLLDECRNTFKDVFDRVDAALGGSEMSNRVEVALGESEMPNRVEVALDG
ncbi:MAG: hypothetical protein IKO72_05720, partial [Kiritimatiellae bacterium]|nr:hypothetical protein [Kiritimatiellia bacterium]